jgi:hypothetical protein
VRVVSGDQGQVRAQTGAPRVRQYPTFEKDMRDYCYEMMREVGVPAKDQDEVYADIRAHKYGCTVVAARRALVEKFKQRGK